MALMRGFVKPAGRHSLESPPGSGDSYFDTFRVIHVRVTQPSRRLLGC